MPEYLCLAKNTSGHDSRVTIEAESVREAVSALRKQGMVPIEVALAGGKKNKERSAQVAHKGRRRSVKLKEVAVFCRQLSVMLEAGLAMVDSVKDLGEQSENLTFREILMDVAHRMEGGETFSASIGRHPKVFVGLFVSMARAGEEGGSLAKVLSDLSTYLEDQVALRRKVKAATAYPVFIAVFFAGAVGAIVFFLIPRFKKIFKSFHAEMPMLTQVIMSISNWIINNIAYELGLVVALVITVGMMRRTAKGRCMLDQLKLKLPIFGKLFHKVALTRFAQALATLLENGVAMVSALEISTGISGNVIIADVIERCRTNIIQGSSFASEMRREPLFPPMLSQMVSAGEQSGRMSDMLRRFAKFSDEEVTAMVDGLTAIIEPLLIILLGGVVAVVVLAIYLPIFKMAGSMGG